MKHDSCQMKFKLCSCIIFHACTIISFKLTDCIYVCNIKILGFGGRNLFPKLIPSVSEIIKIALGYTVLLPSPTQK